jgi:predicted DCC family thiol-disulfide oxidoreductase YuxK
MIKILFDNQCNICKKEIRYYQSISPSKIFLWCDLHTNKTLLRKYKITHKDALLSLHAIDEKESLYKGVDAFCLIWKHLRGWNLLSLIIKMPIIYPTSKILYKFFALWRFNKLHYCRVN